MDHPPALSRTPRLPGIDAARVIASLATVFFHAMITVGGRGAGGEHVSEIMLALAQTTRFAVGFFAMAAAYFLVHSLRRDASKDYGAFARGRFWRLYAPFLGWTAIYMIASQVYHRLLNGDPPAAVGVSALWTGSSYHLWFLPFLFACLLIAFPIVRWAVRSRPRELVVGLSALVAGVLLATCVFPLRGNEDAAVDTERWIGMKVVGVTLSKELVENTAYFLEKSISRGPAFLWGAALALLWRGGARPGPEGRLHAVSKPMGLVGAAIMIGSMTLIFLQGHMNGVENITGVGLFLVAVSPILSRASLLVRLSPLTYGIYLSHVLMVKLMLLVAGKAGLGGTWMEYPVVLFGAAAATVALTMFLRRFRVTAWLAP